MRSYKAKKGRSTKDTRRATKGTKKIYLVPFVLLIPSLLFNRRDAENAKCFLESTLVFRSIPKRLRVLCVSAVNSPFGCGYAAMGNRVVPSCFFAKVFPKPRSGERM